MNTTETPQNVENLRFLPSIDALLRSRTAGRLLAETGAKHLTVLARSVIDALRRELLENAAEETEFSRENLLAEAEARLEQAWRGELNTSLKRVINATGVIIHTNLGRAPLSENARRAVAEEAARYCNLEYNLETGKRGKRGARAEHLLAELTGAESALIVNNCAAAAFLILTVLAAGGEVVISRGELVEIGGDFRVPDVLTQSGATLREVGTTNRTKLSDYERAIGDRTRVLLKVHPSNYRIVGFTATPSLTELAELAHRHELLLYEDAGSGAMFDLTEYGLGEEPVVSRSIVAGADIVSFSGDKLLGGVQSGLIVGRREIVERLRRHPLYRALRVDKLSYAALEATLEAFRKETFVEEIPVLRMLSAGHAELMRRTARFADRLRERTGENAALRFEITEGNSVIGGGSAPDVQPATALLSLRHAAVSVSRLEEQLRGANPPVITRILEDRLLIDLRTVSETEEEELLGILSVVS
ncbi:MAG: L-seryl-tRNA(Sec) selenium transferase [Acidobacteria bacterium]|nr:L-seryl-tRNA(Sec) selenium transferase [Acidobacteriota bacterium]